MYVNVHYKLYIRKMCGHKTAICVTVRLRLLQVYADTQGTRIVDRHGAAIATWIITIIRWKFFIGSALGSFGQNVFAIQIQCVRWSR